MNHQEYCVSLLIDNVPTASYVVSDRKLARADAKTYDHWLVYHLRLCLRHEIPCSMNLTDLRIIITAQQLLKLGACITGTSRNCKEHRT